MQDVLNFRLETVSSRAFSVLEKNGSWSGLAGSVAYGQAVLAISSSAMLQSIAANFRFLVPHTYQATPTMTYAAPETKSRYIRLYVGVFQPGVWISIAGMLCLTFVVRACISGEKENSLWFTLAFFLLQGWKPAIEKRNSGSAIQPGLKALTITLGLTCSLLYAIFSSKFISSLSVKQDSIALGLDDLISKGVKFGVCNESYLATAAQMAERQEEQQELSSMSIVDRLFTNLDALNPYMPLESGLQLAYGNWMKYSIVCELSVYTPLYKHFSPAQICNQIHSVLLPEYHVELSAFVARGSEWSQYFNYARIMMMERGLTQLFLLKQKQYHEESVLPCEKPLLRSFELVEVWLPFYVLGSGFVLSNVFLIVEILQDLVKRSVLIRKFIK